MSDGGRFPTYFLPHGGGPCFFMDPPPGGPGTWDRMADFLRSIPTDLVETPRAILIVTGHWETEGLAVTAGAHPALIFDYYGFPESTYRLTYPAPGAPELAAQVAAMLSAAGFPTREDPERGFDHGMFIPLKVAFPEAAIPVVELSVRRDLDPAAHIEIGRALAPLRDEGILILATGMSYHNLRGFFTTDPRAGAASEAFDAWLTKAVCQDSAAREAALIGWEGAPAARACHPQEEHLIPLMVAAGAAGADAATHAYADVVLGKRLSGFRFG
ncbi:MAG TPA: class III extradiol ring-cleavage dioxygenase [Acidisoma sp.]|uniref:DODA-type extradiol aromatic ring-opening family dioxygenase n=1 Tax=Acidisoma sp. TaxID=1872115 RepID=UPI002BD37F57|nr:class III extradiol ring-cleavage dioxygenase [Acidisoma sp.]HTH99704.1 class III extradiol ring-cleavage dioxygenase [Acidisoma sp.]